ncbi:MAG: NADH:flavin oxidoreductase [Myxococcales bacterium]|nr:NADH:flavin oxidoreductase [Myxococcales bacterium]
MSERHPRIASLRTPDALRERLESLGVPLPCDDAVLAGADSPLAEPLALGPGPAGALLAGNRFVIQPMEGWDGSAEGRPTELTERRWKNFGRSGAGWIWGGEAVAVRREGRANPGQLVIDADTAPDLAALRETLVTAAREAGGPEPVVGLQLTHSGRWSRPEGPQAPRVAYRHPLLDRRVGVEDAAAVLSDEELDGLVADFARAARLAREAGFSFVDVKHCHGYLLHEFLSARTRPGRYGGEGLADRSALTAAILAAVREAAPDLRIGVRLSVFDQVPYAPGVDGRGEPELHARPYRFGFGLDPDEPARIDLGETIAFVRWLAEQGVDWLNVTASSPYYAPHLQRPALFPPSDGYLPPEDPLVGVARLLGAARDLKQAVPGMVIVSSGWTYLQEYLPHVAQACVRDGWFDAVGLGRMVLSYPELPADALAGRPLVRKKVCRTFSDCTTAPRNGLVSGCYPLDPFYRERPERKTLDALKRGDT